MHLKRKQRGKKISLDFTRRKRARPVSEDEATRRRRMIEEYIREHGVTRCEPGYSHMGW